MSQAQALSGAQRVSAALRQRLDALRRLVVPSYARRAKLRAAWGSPGEAREGLFASRAFELMGAGGDGPCMDDKSWRDLEFSALFSALNTTISPLGGQLLYRQMRSYKFDAQQLPRRYQAYRILQADRALREQLQLILAALEIPSAAYIIGALLGPRPVKPKRPWLIYCWAMLSPMALVAALALSLTPWIWIGVLAVNATVTLITSASRGAAGDLDELINCRRMLGVADRLAAVRADAGLDDVSSLAAERQKRAGLRRASRWLALVSSNSDVLTYILWAADLCCIARLLIYTRTVDRFIRSRGEWLSTYELVGSVDAAIAVANFLQRLPRHCQPVVADERTISIIDGYHPLIPVPVENSVTLERRSALISGSNMAGKTAFIKMVGTNIVLGHTLGFCLAARATIPRSPVMASIQGEQSLLSGKSRYFAEIEAIRSFIQHASRGECRVFVIDELFSGTNTTERIAAARAVLLAISAEAQVLATTHDAELQQLLADRFELYYFQEDPAVVGFFDHRLRRGISSERNAIRLLERMNFPPAVVQDAFALVQRQRNLPERFAPLPQAGAADTADTTDLPDMGKSGNIIP
ncbi:MAG TPA: hypothetical protein VHX52_01945 [Steroidobacteraceae bacterium]|jgi:hypothetical protein|nr:hypothetical protein [Steroidobacteraceae bacterium]